MLRRPTYEALQQPLRRRHPAGDHARSAVRRGRRAAGDGREDRRSEARHRGFYLRTADRAAIARHGPRRAGRSGGLGRSGAVGAVLPGRGRRHHRRRRLRPSPASSPGCCAASRRPRRSPWPWRSARATWKRADALSGVRSWDETLRRIAAGWPRHRLEIDCAGLVFRRESVGCGCTEDKSSRHHPAKVAVITGAARGIGRAIAEQLIADGYAVMIADIRGEAAEQTAAELAAGGAAAIACQTDVADPDACQEMVARPSSAWAGWMCWSTTPASASRSRRWRCRRKTGGG